MCYNHETVMPGPVSMRSGAYRLFALIASLSRHEETSRDIEEYI